jgi:hypothetical protein
MALDWKRFVFSRKLVWHPFFAKKGNGENIFIAYSANALTLTRKLIHTKFNTVLMNFIKSQDVQAK